MKKKITINYLSHDRLNFTELMFHFLSKIKEENKEKIKLNVLATYENNWKDLCDRLGIDYKIHIVQSGRNYLDKIDIALSADTEYCVKLDEDNFANNYIWDYMIENADILQNDEYLALAPIMTNNIPSCDFFIEHYITDPEVRSTIYGYFLRRSMPNGLWGVDYSPLNKYTIYANDWNPTNFYKGVAELNTPTMGIHPLRISYDAQKAINDYVVDHVDSFVNKKDYSIFTVDTPYYNNGISLIRTSEWRKILQLSQLSGFDEVALNMYKNQNNKSILFIENAFAIHPMFNTVFGDQNPWNIGSSNAVADELDFYNKLLNKVI